MTSIGRVVVIGAGLGGLAVALFLGRRGVRVSLIERDPSCPPPCSEDFASWSRRGVAQMRQPHVVLPRGAEVLVREAPDVLADLASRGARLLTMEGRDPAPGAPFHICARRPILEAALRSAVIREPLVEMSAGVEAVGLESAGRGTPPRVEGVKLSDGRTLASDLVVDAAGRWAPASRWLAAVGAQASAEYAQPLEFHYVTRWYRLKAGASLPSQAPTSRASAGFASISVFMGDAATFALSALVSLRDPGRAALRNPDAFERVMRASRLARPFVEAGEPISEPLVLSRVENRSVTLLREGRAVAAGLVLVGDAAVHTNPTLGFGASLALLMAERLAAQARLGGVKEAGFVEAFEGYRGREIEPWFRAQVQADATTLREMRRRLARLDEEAPSERDERFMRALELEARAPGPAREAFVRFREMGLAPDALARHAGARAAVRRRLRRRRPFEAPPEDMSREAFEAALGLHRSQAPRRLAV